MDMQNPTGFSELCDGSGVDRAGRNAGISNRPAREFSASAGGNARGRAEAAVVFESRHSGEHEGDAEAVEESFFHHFTDT